MARNVLEKLAKGEKLDEDDVRYATDRGIELPEEYGQQVEHVKHAAEPNFGTPDGPVVAGGTFPAAQQDMGPGLFLTTDQLESLKADTLRELAEAAGVEVSGRKADMAEQLAGADTSEEADEG